MQGIQLPLDVELDGPVTWKIAPEALLTIDSGAISLRVRMAAIGVISRLPHPLDGIHELAHQQLKGLGVSHRTAVAASNWLLSPLISSAIGLERHLPPDPTRNRGQLIKVLPMIWDRVIRISAGLPIDLYPAWIGYTQWAAPIAGQNIMRPSSHTRTSLSGKRLWRLSAHWHELSYSGWRRQTTALQTGGWLWKPTPRSTKWLLISDPATLSRERANRNRPSPESALRPSPESALKDNQLGIDNQGGPSPESALTATDIQAEAAQQERPLPINYPCQGPTPWGMCAMAPGNEDPQCTDCPRKEQP